MLGKWKETAEARRLSMRPISQLQYLGSRLVRTLLYTHCPEPRSSRRSRRLCCISTTLCVGLVLVLSSWFCFAQNWPGVSSKHDVARADPNLEMIRIPHLPIEYYPLLSKFKRLKEISFYWEGANDEKLRELSTLTFTNLEGISLLDCPSVTDEGVRAIANFPSLKWLKLEGTSVTDTSLEVMATRMDLVGLNVDGCKGVTRSGIRRLALCPSLQSITFSTEGWTQEHVIELIDSFKNVKWCVIIDPQNRLDAELLKAKGKARGIQIVVKPSGALETNREFRRKHSLH